MRFRTEGNEIVFDDGGMNLLSSGALRELGEVIRHVARDTPLLTFRFARSAGADMNEMLAFDAEAARRFSRDGQEVFESIGKLPMLTVALVDGDCFGGALDLAMSFDLRFATPRSRFSHPGARLGIVTGFGGTSRWRRIVGRSAVNALMLGNHILSAEEALSIGLVDRVGEDHREALEQLKALDPGTVQLVKTLTNTGDRLTRSQLLLMAARLGELYEMSGS